MAATDWMTSMTMERDSLKVQLQESERLRQEAFAACETMRLERDEWKSAVEYQQQQATQLRLQVEALEASVEDWQSANKKLAGQVADKQQQSQLLMRERDDLQAKLADADAQIRQFEQINDTRDELQRHNKDLQAKLEVERGRVAELQRQALIAQGTIDEWRDAWERATGVAEQHKRQVSDLQAQLDAAKNEANKTGWVVVGSHLPDREQLDTEIVRLRNNWSREIDERKALQQQVAELQAQLEAAAVTPAQQPDGNAAEQLKAVRRMIGEIWGWYACVECLGEQSAETWEQVGALLGHLQQEAD